MQLLNNLDTVLLRDRMGDYLRDQLAQLMRETGLTYQGTDLKEDQVHGGNLFKAQVSFQPNNST